MPAAFARASTSCNWECSRGSVRWQWESIMGEVDGWQLEGGSKVQLVAGPSTANHQLPTSHSERRLECVRRVADLRLAVVGPDHRDHVEARGRLADAVAAQVVLGGLGDLVLLVAVDLLFGGGVVLGAGFHLAEDD